MKQHVTFLKLISVLYVLLFLSACGGSGNKKNNNEQDSTKNTNEITTQEEKVFYRVPAPDDLLAFLNNKKLPFNTKILNSTQNADKYGDTKSKEINFGIYTADMAYCASFNKYQETLKYFQVVRDLGNEINVSSVFNTDMSKKIDKIINDKDSLKTVTSDAYNKISNYLESNNRKRSLALILTGGWVESIFIVTNLLDKFDPKHPSVQLIADQKYVLQTLTDYLGQNKKDEAVQTTLNDLAPIKKIFDNLKVEKIETKKETTNAPNQIIVGGDTKIVISEKEFIALKEAITKLRNSITENKNTK